MVLSVPAAEITGTFLELLGYGAYLVIFPQCVSVLSKKKLGLVHKIYFFVTMLFIFLLSTMHLGVDLYRIYMGFTSHMETGGYTEAFFKVVNTNANIVKNSSLVTTTLVADLLLVYRTFIVWGRNVWIAILPFMIFCVDFAMSVWFTWSIRQAVPGNSVLISSVFQRSKYFFVATLVLNLLCTFLIAWKIFSVSRAISGISSTRGGGASRALSIIVESAALYTMASVFMIVTSITSSSMLFFFVNSMPSLIGCVFSYVILRSSTDHNRYLTNTTNMSLSGGSSSYHSRNPMGSLAQRSNISSAGVHVQLETILHQDNAHELKDLPNKDASYSV